MVRSPLAAEDVRRGLPYAIGVGIRRGGDGLLASSLQRSSHLTPLAPLSSRGEGGKDPPPEGRRDRSAEGREGSSAEDRRDPSAEGRRDRSAEGREGSSAEGRADRSAEGSGLYPEEEGILGPNATARRRFYFALGRAAARDALAELGVAPVAILRGSAGEPVWPDGMVGAITHTGDLAIAIVGWQTDYAGLGVDLERLTPGLSARAARLVGTPAERAWIGDGVEASRGTMLFSAKEAVFKALFPIEHIWLGFADAELAWQPERSLFEARLLKHASSAYPVGAVLQVQCTLTDAEVLCTTHALPGR